MSRFRSIVVLLVGALLSSNQLCAQEYGSSWATFDFTKSGNSWLSTLNPAGLTTLSAPSISQLDLSFTRDHGGLVDYYQSNDSFELSGGVESLYRYSDRVVLSGEVGYSYFTGKNASGSSLFDPYFNPFDITEFNSDNSGNIAQEKYYISGGVGWAATDRLSLGMDFSLLGGNYAKMKDLRHTNILSDLDLQLGVSYRLGDFTLGLSYQLEHHIESISFSRYYETNYIASMLRSYGLFWGRSDSFSSSVATTFISTSKLPIVNFSNILGAQLSYDLSPSTQVLIEGIYSMRDGEVGVDETDRPIFNTFDITTSTLNLKLVSSYSDIRHIASANLSSQSSTTMENNYRFLVDEGGGSYVSYLSPKQVSAISATYAEFDYRLQLAIRDSIALYEFSLYGDFMQQSRSATIYPYNRTDNSSFYSLGINAKHNIVSGRGVLSPEVAVEYFSGLGAGYDDVILATGSTNNPTRTADEFMLKQMEYQQSQQVAASLAVGYMYRYSETLKLGASLGYSYRFALEAIEHLSSDYRHSINLTLAVIF